MVLWARNFLFLRVSKILKWCKDHWHCLLLKNRVRARSTVVYTRELFHRFVLFFADDHGPRRSHELTVLHRVRAVLGWPHRRCMQSPLWCFCRRHWIYCCAVWCCGSWPVCADPHCGSVRQYIGTFRPYWWVASVFIPFLWLTWYFSWPVVRIKSWTFRSCLMKISAAYRTS